MKKVLITGSGSYIGTAFEKWLHGSSGCGEKYDIRTVDMQDDSWKQKSFAGYDTVFHVAGIAHVSSDPKLKDLYFKVNRDLAVNTAFKARNEGARQFIFMSSIIVYGDPGRNGKVIGPGTMPEPSNFYGESKFEAENGIRKLESNVFKVVILRPPMIYGIGCRGNYPRLAKLALKVPFFPDHDNRRSMLHIDNLCEFIRLMIEYNESGVFYPQNAEYVRTSDLVKVIAETHGKKIRMTRIMEPLIRLAGGKGIVGKVFGDLVYELDMSRYEKADYRVRNFAESIRLTEIGDII
ncbi:MAG: NAD-dependent epimerase/dehydratase family protein [Saccharofermentanales bacterium]